MPTWPKSVGKSIQTYLEEVSLPLTERAFAEIFRAYIKEQLLGEPLDSGTVRVLFQITRDFLSNRAAISAMDAASIEKDWLSRKRALDLFARGLTKVRVAARKSVQSRDRPLTSNLATSIGKKVDVLLRELDQVATFQRAQASMFKILRRSTRGEKACVLMLNEYLEHEFPELRKRDHDIIIAGALIASGIKDDKQDRVANLPMARKRAQEFRDEDGIVVPWLNDAEEMNKNADPSLTIRAERSKKGQRC